MLKSSHPLDISTRGLKVLSHVEENFYDVSAVHIKFEVEGVTYRVGAFPSLNGEEFGFDQLKNDKWAAVEDDDWSWWLCVKHDDPSAARILHSEMETIAWLEKVAGRPDPAAVIRECAEEGHIYAHRFGYSIYRFEGDPSTEGWKWRRE